MGNPRALGEESGSSQSATVLPVSSQSATVLPVSTDTAAVNTKPGIPMSTETAVADTDPSTSKMHNLPESMDTEDDEDSDLCKKCNKTGKEGVQWIQCNSCSGWFNRNCAGLRAKKAWVKFSETGAEFFCSECK